MLRTPEPVLMLVADISGYTTYLAGTEIDHAQNVLEDLLEVVHGRLVPTFTLVKPEGDALFLFAPGGQVSGPMLLDTIDACYFAFRRRLRDVSQATSCTCNACVLIPRLDLKFVVHAGRAVRQSSFGATDLIGPDVIVLHRLLKNHVVEEHGWHAYALLTDPAVASVGLDCLRLGMGAHREVYEDAGEVIGWVEDLEARWKQEQARSRVQLDPDDEIWSYAIDVPAAPSVAWEWITTPRLRARWQVGVIRVDQETVDGRPGVGTTNHCVHGKDAILEEILDWQPFDTLTLRSVSPGGPLLTTYELAATGQTTHLMARVSAATPEGRALADVIRLQLEVPYGESLRQLVELLGAETQSVI